MGSKGMMAKAAKKVRNNMKTGLEAHKPNGQVVSTMSSKKKKDC